jgi:ligand-binding sensor domain-containing protein
VRRDLVAWGFAYLRDTLYTATNGGLLVGPVPGGVYGSDTVVTVYETTQGRVDSLELVPGFRSVASVRDTIWVGGDHGVARRRPGNADWDIDFFIPRDSVDLITQSEFADNSDTSISGNFVIAFAIQNYGGQQTVWASTRPVSSPQYLGVSRSTDDGRTWEVSLAGKVTWNLATFEQHVWAATNDGLWHTTDAGVNWAKVDIVDAANGTAFYDGTEVLSVKQIDANRIFVGSEDGFARSTDGGATWTITRSFAGIATAAAGGADAEVFAAPVPFSPGRDVRLRIHYKPVTDGAVHIEVFDFAMQKVATILNGVFRAGLPGPDPDGTNHYIEEWDALNDDGRSVATGVYFFRVEMDNTAKWGKLVILP